ncbi:MAG TPA: hypothetical protein VKG63_05385 [Steroidobacteraceae bacterium]|nr:hypothetical protein [Steroidobacteraceae bacterium]
MRSQKSAIGSFGLIVVQVWAGSSGSAGGAEVSFAWSLQAPAQSTVAPGAPLRIGLPSQLSSAQLASLAIELDHIDVTALAHIAAGQISFAPPQPLSAGPHELAVFEYAADGRPQPRGVWKFAAVVAGSSAPKNWSVKGSAGAQVSERVAESHLSDPAPPRLTANSTFDLKAARTSAEWSAEGTVNGLYGSDNGTSALSGQGLQPAQMQLALKHLKDSIVIGDQTLAFDNLLISGLSRRGISGHLADLPLGVETTAFSVRDSSLAGFYGGLGVGDSNDRVSGVIVQSRPLTSKAEALTVSVAFVSGTSPGGLSVVAPYPGGNGMFPPTTPGTVTTVQSGSGSAWLLALNSQVPGTTLKLNGQFAESTFDFPGTLGQNDTRLDDHAYNVGLTFGHPLIGAWNFNMSAGYQFVGTYFTSLANPTLPPDRSSASLSATTSGHGIVVAASGAIQEDNTDDNASIATVRSVPLSLTGSYSPTLPAHVTEWLGTPAINASVQDTRTHNITSPAASMPTDNDLNNDTLGVAFSYKRFTWQVGVAGGRFRDHTGQQDDTNNFGPTLGFNVTLGRSGSVAFNMQLLDTHDLQQDTHTLDRNYSLSAADSFLGDKMSAQFTLTENHNTQQVNPFLLPPQMIGNDVVLRTATGQLLWHAIPATARRGGLDVGLSSSWNESSGLNTAVLNTQGFSSLATHGFQTFLTLGSRWPLNLGDR